MLHVRSVFGALALAAAIATLGVVQPPGAAATRLDVSVVAILDGRTIPLKDVARYYCDDFAFPTITCATTVDGIEARASVVLLATAVEYVTIYESAGYSGPYMHVSQDYNALSFIGWNDRISSFKGRNAETGRFFTDWFYSGTIWSFCCNQQLASLGAYDNTFSSIQRI